MKKRTEQVQNGEADNCSGQKKIARFLHRGYPKMGTKNARPIHYPTRWLKVIIQLQMRFYQQNWRSSRYTRIRDHQVWFIVQQLPLQTTYRGAVHGATPKSPTRMSFGFIAPALYNKGLHSLYAFWKPDIKPIQDGWNFSSRFLAWWITWIWWRTKVKLSSVHKSQPTAVCIARPPEYKIVKWP